MALFPDLLEGKAPTVTGVFLCQDVVNMEAVSMPLNATVRLGGLELIVILVTLMVFFLTPNVSGIISGLYPTVLNK